MSALYLPIFFENDWIHQKYYGWKTFYEEKFFKILLQRKGPIKRYLILSCSNDKLLIEKHLTCLKIFNPLSEIILQDFSDEGVAQRLIAGKIFLRAGKKSRMLNSATFVIDLSHDEDVLSKKMHSDYRRERKKALEQGIVIDFIHKPLEHSLNIFFERYKKLALEHALDIPSRSLIESMLSQGSLMLVQARSADSILSMALIYLTMEKGFYLYGVSGQSKNDGSGKMLHWETIKYLKNRNLHWYDLGGVPEINEANGIYLFKKRFGGELVPLGTQYVFKPTLVRAAHFTFRMFNKIARR